MFPFMPEENIVTPRFGVTECVQASKELYWSGNFWVWKIKVIKQLNHSSLKEMQKHLKEHLSWFVTKLQCGLCDERSRN